MKAIIAVNKVGFIGKDNKLPWRSSADLKHFKEKTLGCTLLVGRTTYESMPKLDGRLMIVVGEGYNTLDVALSFEPDWVIGGKRLMESTIHLCDELHISEINDETVGDVESPNFDGFEGEKFVYNFDVD
jgi:dihydrofolate reductase